MKRILAHSDCNCFYAGVEMLRNPRLRDVPFAVCGRTEQRNGIVLTANYPAKRKGVKTGMANWEAKQACPGLYIVHPHYSDYVQFSGFVKEIYNDYSGRVESFGLDECWLDLTGCVKDFEAGIVIVNEIRERIKRELGLTVSIGLADNKVFAKLGSDMKKPDACTIIRKENFREQIWPLPVEDLLYVGRATKKKLNIKGVRTIGELAQIPQENLQKWFGKIGLILHTFANGEDKSEVAPYGYEAPIKSVGNSQTCPRDLDSDEDVKIMIYALSDSISGRLMEQGFYASTVEFNFVTSDLKEFGSRQCKLPNPTYISGEIADSAYKLFKENWGWRKNLRKIGVKACDLTDMEIPRQLNIWESPEILKKRENLERAVHNLRHMYGNKIIRRAIMLTAPDLDVFDIKNDNIIHPLGVRWK
jgi:DNA polymerase-4